MVKKYFIVCHYFVFTSALLCYLLFVAITNGLHSSPFHISPYKFFRLLEYTASYF